MKCAQLLRVHLATSFKITVIQVFFLLPFYCLYSKLNVFALEHHGVVNLHAISIKLFAKDFKKATKSTTLRTRHTFWNCFLCCLKSFFLGGGGKSKTFYRGCDTEKKRTCPHPPGGSPVPWPHPVLKLSVGLAVVASPPRLPLPGGGEGLRFLLPKLPLATGMHLAL